MQEIGKKGIAGSRVPVLHLGQLRQDFQKLTGQIDYLVQIGGKIVGQAQSFFLGVERGPASLGHTGVKDQADGRQEREENQQD
jgi:hypothetical protein